MDDINDLKLELIASNAQREMETGKRIAATKASILALAGESNRDTVSLLLSDLEHAVAAQTYSKAAQMALSAIGKGK